MTVLRAATRGEIAGVWTERWGGHPGPPPGARPPVIVTVEGTYEPQDVRGLVALDDLGVVSGLVTWAIAGGPEPGGRAEIVTLDALTPGRGTGALLLAAAERTLAAGGVGGVHLVTSNDNVRALAFYQRHGYRMVRLHLDAMAGARALKPTIPPTDERGVPLRDVWGLEKAL